MAAGFCLFHKKYLSRDEVKVKKCRKKDNTKEVCKHFIDTDKQTYRNDISYLSKANRR